MTDCFTLSRKQLFIVCLVGIVLLELSLGWFLLKEKIGLGSHLQPEILIKPVSSGSVSRTSASSGKEGSTFFEHATDTVDDEVTVINVAVSTEVRYGYPTYIALFSMAVNSNKDVKYNVTVLHHPYFPNNLKDAFWRLEQDFPNIKVNLIDMGNSFSDYRNYIGMGPAMYYRLNLPYLLPDVKLCLYFDGDVLVRGDISEFFKINMSGYYVVGARDFNKQVRKGTDYHQELGIPDVKTYISSGTLLLNLEEIRNDGKDIVLSKLIKEKAETFYFPDQDAINVAFYGHILCFTPKQVPLAHTTWASEQEGYISWISEDKAQWEEDIKNPTIFHFTGHKPWGNVYSIFREEWWQYVDKSPFKNEIRSHFHKH